MTHTCDFCGAEMLDAGPPIGTYCSAGKECKGWKTGYNGLFAKLKAPDVKDLIYKHHGLILTDEESGKDCCDFGTVERVVEAITADLRTQLAERDTVIAQRDSTLAEVNARMLYLEQNIIPCAIKAIRQDAPVVALEALVQATRQSPQLPARNTCTCMGTPSCGDGAFEARLRRTCPEHGEVKK